MKYNKELYKNIFCSFSKIKQGDTDVDVIIIIIINNGILKMSPSASSAAIYFFLLFNIMNETKSMKMEERWQIKYDKKLCQLYLNPFYLILWKFIIPF